MNEQDIPNIAETEEVKQTKKTRQTKVSAHAENTKVDVAPTSEIDKNQPERLEVDPENPGDEVTTHSEDDDPKSLAGDDA